jgi:hypothetical protein
MGTLSTGFPPVRKVVKSQKLPSSIEYLTEAVDRIVSAIVEYSQSVVSRWQSEERGIMKTSQHGKV